MDNERGILSLAILATLDSNINQTGSQRDVVLIGTVGRSNGIE